MFTEQELEILRVLVNCIIPADEYPDGWSVGVGDYLLKQFKGDLQPQLPQYQAGLASLDEEAKVVYEQPFSELSAANCISLLENIEAGESRSNSVDLQEFFLLVIEHAYEGFYSNPENGGNKDAIAWQMIGFEVIG